MKMLIIFLLLFCKNTKCTQFTLTPLEKEYLNFWERLQEQNDLETENFLKEQLREIKALYSETLLKEKKQKYGPTKNHLDQLKAEIDIANFRLSREKNSIEKIKLRMKTIELQLEINSCDIKEEYLKPNSESFERYIENRLLLLRNYFALEKEKDLMNKIALQHSKLKERRLTKPLSAYAQKVLKTLKDKLKKLEDEFWVTECTINKLKETQEEIRKRTKHTKFFKKIKFRIARMFKLKRSYGIYNTQRYFRSN